LISSISFRAYSSARPPPECFGSRVGVYSSMRAAPAWSMPTTISGWTVRSPIAVSAASFIRQCWPGM
jgi:hypothetical protein